MNMIDLQNCVNEVVLSYRLRCNEAGSDNLIRLLDVLESVSGNEKHGQLMETAELNLLRRLFDATQRADYLFIADLLEYELPYSRLWEMIEWHCQNPGWDGEQTLLLDT